MNTDEERRESKRNEFKQDNNIGKLQRRMYSRERKGFLPWRSRREVKGETILVKRDWEHTEPEQEEQSSSRKEGSYSGASALLIFSIMFFVLAGVGAFAYLRLAIDTSSASEVDIAIEGSSSISAGDVLELQVLVTNRNDTALELADLVVTYPEGTVSPADFRTPLRAERIPLGLVEPRSARRGAVRAVVLGNNGELKDIKVELQYRLRGNSAIHSRTTSHAALIATDAMSIAIDANKQLTPGQTVPMSITVKSHTNTVLNGVYLDLSFPFGFTVVDNAPAPSDKTDDAQRWLLGSLRPGEERIIQISGTLDGQAGDVRTIGIETGSGIFTNGKTDNQDDSGIVLARAEHVIEVRKSFLEITLENNSGRLADYIAHAGSPFDVMVKWRNNLRTPITDATIALTLGGLALDKATVDAGEDGFYRSVDSLLLWDAKTSRETLQNIAPGASGEFKFRLTPLPRSFLDRVPSPYISFVVHAAGKRLSEQGVPEVLKEDSITEVKVGTDTNFDAYGLFKSSPFGTLGPLPPKAEYETTYAIVWEVSNTTSDIKEAVVRAELPHYVRWIGLTTPANEQIIYNKTNKTLEWHLGTVKAGTGIKSQLRTVSFALGLVPSASQIGDAPDLIRNQSFEAIDVYTGELLGNNPNNVDTRIIRDEAYSGEESRVVK